MIGLMGFEEGCGDGCCGGHQHGDASSIGDIYDDVSTYHQQTYAQMVAWGARLTQDQQNLLAAAFQAVQRAVGSDSVYDAVAQAHQLSYRLLSLGLGHEPSPAQAQVLLDHFHRLQAAVPGKSGFWAGVVDVAAVAAPIVGGIVGSVIPGVGTAIGAGLGGMLGGAIKGGVGGAVDAGASAAIGIDIHSGFGTGLGTGSGGPEPVQAPPPAPAAPPQRVQGATFNRAANLVGLSARSGPVQAVTTLATAPAPSTGGGMRPALALMDPSGGPSKKTLVTVGAVALVGGFLAWRMLR